MAYNPTDTASDWFLVAPSDAQDLPQQPRFLFVGNGGTIIARSANGKTETFQNVSSGSYLMISPARIYATGTTASGIIGLL